MTTTNQTTRAAVLILAVALAAPAALAADCYVARVDQALLLPDGTVTGGGQVRVCRVKQLTPASTLHSLTIAGHDAGMFLGTRQTVELAEDERDAPPSFLFARVAGSALEFKAVAYRVGGRYQAFRADRIGRGRERVLTRAAFEMAMAHDPGSELVAVVAAD